MIVAPPPDSIRGFLSYDPATGRFCWTSSRGSRKAGTEAGNVTPRGYRKMSFLGRFLQAHRLAWWFAYNEWPDKQIDHINGNRLDNRLCNLRLADASENGCNRAGRKPFKGVTYHRRRKRFQAQIKKDGRNHYLGLFETEAEAHAAYVTASTVFHGKFARAA